MSAAHWLNATRIRVYPKIILLLYILVGTGAIGYWLCESPRPALIVSDLTVFWIAAGFAKAGHAAQAYSPEQVQQVMSNLAPEIKGNYGWFYPPTFFLFIAPMGWLPYWGAYLAFMGISVAGYIQTVRQIIQNNAAMWCLAAFPGIWINLLTGQNGLLTAALAGSALLLLERQPNLAGILVGLLVIKPHLALLFPVALIAMRAWRILVTAGLTAMLSMGVSVLILGFDTLNAWQHSLESARAIMEKGGTAPMMPTVFAFMRLLNVPPELAYTAHTLIALWAVAIVWRVWKSNAIYALKAATLMTATLLVSPYLFEYDLAWLGFPIAWLAKTGLDSTWRPGEREVLLAAWILPLVVVVIAWQSHIQIGPWVSAALQWVIANRVLGTRPWWWSKG